MRRSIARWIVAGTIAVGAAGVGLGCPRWVIAVGADLWKLPVWNRQIVLSLISNEHLDHQLRCTVNRLEAKQNIVDEVYYGRLSLREAAARFRNLNQANPKFVELFRIRHPNCSDDECHYRNVIEFAAQPGGRYQNEDRFIARLTAEFQALKDRDELRLED